MKITKKLIERYLSGECTTAEQMAVEKWMSSADMEEGPLPENELNTMASDMWVSLKRSIPARGIGVIVPWNGWLRLVAACVVVGLMGSMMFLYRNADVPIALHNDSRHEDVNGEARSIAFSLSPNSSVNGSISRYGHKGQLNITGSLRMTSHKGNALEIDFGLSNHGAASRRKATITDRQMYYVGVLKQADTPDEILVVSSEQLEDIPPRIKIMAFNDYDI